VVRVAGVSQYFMSVEVVTSASKPTALRHLGKREREKGRCSSAKTLLAGFHIFSTASLPAIGCFPSRLLSGALFYVLLVVGCARSSSTGDTLKSRLFGRVEVIGARGSALGQFNKPRSVAVDRQDNLYVVDMTGRVQKFSPQGEFLLSWQLPQTDLGKPKGMCTDTNGNIIVLEPHYQRVNHFAPDSTLVEQWGRRGTNAGELILPRAVAANSHGDIFVSEYTTVDRVQGFRAAGRQPFLCFGQPGAGNGEFNRAEGLGIGSDDRIYVADSCNHRIQVFSPDGQWLKSFGTPGRSPGELSYPYDVRLDRDGRRFVCEFGNSRIQVFDANNQFLEIIGGPGTAPGQFNNPWSIALDSQGNLYVADSGNHRVQKLLRR
jgi:DNA-binding beta-propeller fold protein YncE